MKILEIRDDGTGVCDLDGVRRDVNLAFIEKPGIGEYVIVHAGFAIERLDEKEANERIALFDELAQATPATKDGRNHGLRQPCGIAWH